MESVLSSMKALQVRPGQSLGGFEVGMAINDALNILKELFIPERPFIDILYSTTSPLGKSILLRVPDVGLHLYFDPVYQRLKTVEISRFDTLPLSYSGVTFSGPNRASGDSTSFLKLYKLLGPTYPGQFDKELQLYILKYRGLCFMFPIPEEYQGKYEAGNDLPLELPDGKSPKAHRMYIFEGFDVKAPILPDSVLGCLSQVNVFLGQQLLGSEAASTSLEFSSKNSSRSFVIQIGSSVQDTLSELGSPSSIYFKQDDKMRIHSLNEKSKNSTSESFDSAEIPKDLSIPNEHSRNRNDVNKTMTAECFKSFDYFYNYFDIGVDLLFDCNSHKVKKIVLHSNFPGHPEFSIYRKCHFTIVGKANPQAKKSNGIVNDSSHDITAETLWDGVQAIMGSGGKPMIHDSGAVANPFGATYLYAYDGCIFELMKSGHIASVTLF